MSLWRGNLSPRPGWKHLVGTALLFVVSVFVWQLSLRLVPYEKPTGQVGLGLAVLAALLTIAAVWRFVRAFLWLGARRSILLVVVMFALVVAFALYNNLGDRPILIALGEQTRNTAVVWAKWPLDTGRAIIQYLDAFLLAVDGERKPPRLPDGFPTPDPAATPVRVVVPRGN